MNLYFTNYYFSKMVLESLDKKYTEKLYINDTKLFLYANTYQMPELFRLNHSSIKSYDLYTKMTTFRQDLLILNLIKEVKKNKFYPSNVMFLYSLASSLILFEEIKKTNITNKTALEIDYSFAYNNQVMVSGNSLYKKFKNCFIYSFTELDFISQALSNTYYLPQMSTYMNQSIKMFKKILTKNPIFLLVSKFKDFLFFRKKETRFKDKIYKRKYKIESQILITYEDTEIEFNQFLKQTLEKTLKFIDTINDSLYFDRETPLVDFARNYNWSSIVEHYNFVNEQKEEENNRNKKFKLLQKLKKEKKKSK